MTTRVEQHPVVLEDVKPISDVEDTQAQAQGEDSPADEPLAVKPSEPVSDAKVAEDTQVQASEVCGHLDDRVLGENANELFLELNSIQLIMRPHKMSLMQTQLRK